MGRKNKYNTEEERLDAKRKQQMDHYWRNKKEINKKNNERYHRKKENSR